MGCGPGCDPPRVPHGLSWSWCGRAVGQSRQHGAVKAMLPRWKSVLGRNSGISFPVFTPRALQEGRWRSRDCTAGPQCWDGWCRRGGFRCRCLGTGVKRSGFWDVGIEPRVTLPGTELCVGSWAQRGGGSMGRGRPGVPKSPLSRQPQVGLKRI